MIFSLELMTYDTLCLFFLICCQSPFTHDVISLKKAKVFISLVHLSVIIFLMNISTGYRRGMGIKNLMGQINFASHQKTKENHTFNKYPHTSVKLCWLHTSKRRVPFIRDDFSLKQTLNNILWAERKSL